MPILRFVETNKGHLFLRIQFLILKMQFLLEDLRIFTHFHCQLLQRSIVSQGANCSTFTGGIPGSLLQKIVFQKKLNIGY